MTDLRKAAEQALEALEMFCEHGAILRPLETKETLRLALAQPDEVLAEREACAVLCENIERNGAWITKTEAAKAIRSRGVDLARVGEVGVWGHKREWVGLTDEEVDEIYMHEGHEDVVLLTQAKLKEKNT